MMPLPTVWLWLWTGHFTLKCLLCEQPEKHGLYTLHHYPAQRGTSGSSCRLKWISACMCHVSSVSWEEIINEQGWLFRLHWIIAIHLFYMIQLAVLWFKFESLYSPMHCWLPNSAIKLGVKFGPFRQIIYNFAVLIVNVVTWWIEYDMKDLVTITVCEACCFWF